MRNSRKEGLLVVKTDHPFQISKDGEYVNRNMVVCKDITYDVEYVAMDLEQMLTAAIFEVSQNQPQQKVQAQSEDNGNEEFYTKDNPSVAEVEEIANGLSMFLMMSKKTKKSEIIQKFEDLIAAGLITVEKGHSMTIPIWQRIHRKDKEKIVFCYIAFFVNPLQSVAMQTQQQEQAAEATTKSNTL